MYRKVIEQGPITPMISLPSNWAKANSISKGLNLTLNVDRIVLKYLIGPTGVELDDARNIELFALDELSDICFSSHQYTIDKWFRGDYGGITEVDLR